MEGTSGNQSYVLGAYEARLVATIVANALDQDHDDIAGDYFWFLLDDDQIDAFNDETTSDERIVEERREAFARIRETLAGVVETLNGVAR